ncbi:hypothetical protein QCA50_003935 [Cerrena zonata]|uniref:Uncharacterized protein n=1 Tax=Cerrena zonata TaxID=2478898 RepID=A0AAW0GG48_9APHY
MSLSISKPWILNYLTEVAESQGPNLASVKPSSKGKKVQLIGSVSKFLTRQQPGDDSWVWAKISDKEHSIPVRFSKEAIRACMRHVLDEAVAS